jgi:hypothetical protein
MSPQRARGREPSPSCDVYALGVLLYEALTGACVPPEGWSPERLPRVEALRAGVPPALVELVHLCMSIDANRRPASASVVVAVLDAIVGALEAGPGGATGHDEDPEDTLVVPVVDHADADAEDTLEVPVVGDAETALEPLPEEQPPTPRDTTTERAAAWADERAEGSASELEWLGRERQSWLSWVVAAGVVAVVGGSSGWLLVRSMDDEVTSTSAEPTSTAATTVTSETPVPSLDRPAEHERTEVARAEQPPRLERAEPLEPRARAMVETRREPSERAEATLAAEGAEGSSRAPGAGSKTARRPRAAGPSEGQCTDARARADAAKKARAWRAVLQATAQPRCWGSAELGVARARLRVTALAELGEHGRCVAEGARSRDREVTARTALCRKKAFLAAPSSSSPRKLGGV